MSVPKRVDHQEEHQMAAQEIVGDQLPARTLSLKTGGVRLLIGALAFATARVLHGDTPAADADADAIVRRRPVGLRRRAHCGGTRCRDDRDRNHGTGRLPHPALGLVTWPRRNHDRSHRYHHLRRREHERRAGAARVGICGAG